jgi:hypothetical protein
LIEKLNSPEFKSFGYFWKDEDSVRTQAYGDDIFFHSGSSENMKTWIEVVNVFNFQSNIQLNTKKFMILKIGRDRKMELTIQDSILKENNIITFQDDKKLVRYQASLLNTRKIAKMK